MGIPHLYQADIKKFTVILPSPKYQMEIATYLDQKTSEIDRLVASEEKTIQLLKEYRQALISEVVTGKICVLDEVPLTEKSPAS